VIYRGLFNFSYCSPWRRFEMVSIRGTIAKKEIGMCRKEKLLMLVLAGSTAVILTALARGENPGGSLRIFSQREMQNEARGAIPICDQRADATDCREKWCATLNCCSGQQPSGTCDITVTCNGCTATGPTYVFWGGGKNNRMNSDFATIQGGCGFQAMGTSKCGFANEGGINVCRCIGLVPNPNSSCDQNPSTVNPPTRCTEPAG
jgi:hypothetical protein